MEDIPQQQTNLVPRPDPTALTTEQLRRELNGLRELIEAIMHGIETKLETRLDGMDLALQLLQQRSDTIPSEVDQKIGGLSAVYNEKFSSVEHRLLERDKRFEQGATDSKTALDAALIAQTRENTAALNSAKEAVEKSETSFSKQIDQLERQTQEIRLALDSKIEDMKDRLEASINAVALRAEAAIIALRNELLPQITGERTRGDIGAGRQLGQGAMIMIIVGAISVMGIIIGIIFTVMNFVAKVN